MNAGFSSLTKLKAQLLAEALRASSKYDAALLALGKGVVGQFERYCDRKFLRLENATEIIPADRIQFLLSRFPLESIASIELKDNEADGWVAQTISTYVQTIDHENGIVNLPDAADAGAWWAKLRFTFTGGYWVDETEEGNDTLPAGAFAVPDDLFLAWILQCKTVWQSLDKLGTKIVDVGAGSSSVASTLNTLELIPDVKQRLGQYQRYNLV
jgi:hypothetical protein